MIPFTKLEEYEPKESKLLKIDLQDLHILFETIYKKEGQRRTERRRNKE